MSTNMINYFNEMRAKQVEQKLRDSGHFIKKIKDDFDNGDISFEVEIGDDTVSFRKTPAEVRLTPLTVCKDSSGHIEAVKQSK